MAIKGVPNGNNLPILGKEIKNGLFRYRKNKRIHGHGLTRINTKEEEGKGFPGFYIICGNLRISILPVLKSNDLKSVFTKSSPPGRCPKGGGGIVQLGIAHPYFYPQISADTRR